MTRVNVTRENMTRKNVTLGKVIRRNVEEMVRGKMKIRGVVRLPKIDC
jgi:hypothetical protein